MMIVAVLEIKSTLNRLVRTMREKLSSCNDFPGWIDSDGWDCAEYSRYDQCGGNKGWDDDYYPIEYANAQGYSAIDACCACGGGLGEGEDIASDTCSWYASNNRCKNFGNTASSDGSQQSMLCLRWWARRRWSYAYKDTNSIFNKKYYKFSHKLSYGITDSLSYKLSYVITDSFFSNSKTRNRIHCFYAGYYHRRRLRLDVVGSNTYVWSTYQSYWEAKGKWQKANT